MTTGNGNPSLHVVPDPDTVVNPTVEDLYRIAQEKDPTLNQEFFQNLIANRDDLKQVLIMVFKQRKAAEEEAERVKREAANRAAFDEKADRIMKSLNIELHPVKPKEPVQFLSRDEIAKLAPQQEQTLEERMSELRQKYGNKFPNQVFDSSTHQWAMGFRGFLIRVKNGFSHQMDKLRNGEQKTNIFNKTESIQRAIDVLTEIVVKGHGIDVKKLRDPEYRCDNAIYKQIQEIAANDPRMIEHCKVPETKEQAAERLKSEERQRAEQASRDAAVQAEREKMADRLIELMVKVEHFAKMNRDNLVPIATRIARKYSGSTPESKLKMAAREKSDGSKNGQNRQMGIALAKAAGCTAEEISGMFPEAAKEKKDKSKKQ